MVMDRKKQMTPRLGRESCQCSNPLGVVYRPRSELKLDPNNFWRRPHRYWKAPWAALRMLPRRTRRGPSGMPGRCANARRSGPPCGGLQGSSRSRFPAKAATNRTTSFAVRRAPESAPQRLFGIPDLAHLLPAVGRHADDARVVGDRLQKLVGLDRDRLE